MNERAKIELLATPGHVELVVNGENLTAQVQSVIFEAATGDMPRIGILFRDPDFAFEGEGVVTVTKPVDMGPDYYITNFLNSFDPAALDEAVLNSTDMTETPGTAFLRVLKERVDGGT